MESLDLLLIEDFLLDHFETSNQNQKRVVKIIKSIDINNYILSNKYKNSLFLFEIGVGFKKIYHFEKDDKTIFNLIQNDVRTPEELAKITHIIVERLWESSSKKSDSETIEIYRFTEKIKQKILNGLD